MALIHGEHPEAMTTFNKGGKGSTPKPPPMIAPTAPVEEASVEIENNDKKKKARTGKSSLKMPLKQVNTGLKL